MSFSGYEEPMTALRIATLLFALLLAAGEVARWWGQARFVPMALDELLVAAAMFWASAIGRGPLLLFAWGLFCGLMLALLVPTLDHLLNGPPKESAAFYATLLGIMLAIGIGAAAVALRLSRERPR